MQNKQKCYVCSEECFRVHTMVSPISRNITKQQLCLIIFKTLLNKQPKLVSILVLGFVAHTLQHSKRDKASDILEAVAQQNFTLIYSISSFSRAANWKKKRANSLKQKNLITKTEAPPVQSINLAQICKQESKRGAAREHCAHKHRSFLI